MKNHLWLLASLLWILLSISSTAQNQRRDIADVFNDAELNLNKAADRARAVQRMRAIENAGLRRAQTRANAMGIPMRRTLPNGTVTEIVGLDENGEFLIHATRNADAAVSSAANLLYTAPYNLDGSGVTVGVWDESAVRSTHQEFQTDSGSRVTLRNESSWFSSHATHVAGTIAAAGVLPDARGMAPNAWVDSYNWSNDDSEMTAAGATAPAQQDKIYISNHSYGFRVGWEWNGSNWQWYGTGTDQNAYAAQFGQYSSKARSWDLIAYNSPYYLIFHSAGNDNNNNPSNGSQVVIGGALVTYDRAIHPPGDGFHRNATTNSFNGYENIGHQGNSKNIMTIGAVNDAVANGQRDPSKSTLTGFSSRGPTDDGRIKPDIVASGAGVFSTDSGSDSHYSNKSGTSMSSPSAAGSAALLVQLYRDLFPGDDMRASTLKGLIIHTATDLGNPGPDYHYGWGLMNTRKAADLIIDHHANPAKKRMIEDQLTTSEPSNIHAFTWDGASAIRATLSWTDPAGPDTTANDSRMSRLINDLDLKLIAPDGKQHYPYVMPYVGTWTVESMSEPATTGVNNTDNVEQVFIENPDQPGVWQVVVNHKGDLTDDLQQYGLLISGLSAEPPVIEVTRNGSSIGVNRVDGVGGTSAGVETVLTYTIANIGGGPLELTTPVAISNESNCTVTVLNQPSGTIPAGHGTDLALSVAPTSGGTWSFSVSIPNNDPEKGSYHWTVTGIAGSSATVSFTPIADTYISDQAVGTNYGPESILYLNNRTGGNPGSRAVMRGLLRFDLSSIPSDATIESATLDLVQDNGSPGPVNITDVSGSWSETTATWSNSHDIYGETSFGSTNTGTTAGEALPRIQLNASGINRIQSWVTTPAENHGFGITTTHDGGDPGDWLALRSREHSDEAHHPRLTLSYEGGTADLPLMIVSGDNGYITNEGDDATPGTVAGTGTQLGFVIENLGTANLTLTTPIHVAATSNCSVTVSTQPDSPVEASGSTDLVLTVTPSSGGSWSATVSIENNDPAKSPYTWTISGTASKAPATLTLDHLAQTYNATPRVVTATTSPPGLSYSVTYDGQPQPPVNAGSYDIVATITDPRYKGTASGTLDVAKAAQAITFAPLAPVGGDQAPFELAASASSGLPVSYAGSNPAVATVSGSTVTVVDSGTTTITASQPGNENFTPATSVEHELMVVSVVPIADHGGPYKILVGQSLVLDGSASTPSFGESITAWEWDLDNNGTFGDITGATPTAVSIDDLIHVWGMTQGFNTIQLRVTDSANKTSTASTTVELVHSLQWDANGTTAGQTNGGGGWLSDNLWWNGETNVNWIPGSSAVFGGSPTPGGFVSLAGPTTANALIFDTFTGTYTLGTSGRMLTLNGGINKSPTSADVTIASPVTLGAPQSWINDSTSPVIAANSGNAINNDGHPLTIGGSGGFSFNTVNDTDVSLAGSGDLLKEGTGTLAIRGNNTGFTGDISITNGSLMYSGGNALGAGNNISVNGGVLEARWSNHFTRALGTGENQIRIPGGASGFALNGNTSVTFNLGGSAALINWGGSTFNPSTFVLQNENSLGLSNVTFANALNLNGAQRTIQVGGGAAGTARATITGAISNSTGIAGLTKTGNGMLILTNNSSSWNGPTHIQNGILDFVAINPINIGGGSERNIHISDGAGARFGNVNNAMLNRIAETTAEITVMTGTTSNNLDFSTTGANLRNAFLGNFIANNAKTQYTGTLTPHGGIYRLGSPWSRGVLGMTNEMTDGETPRSLIVNHSEFGAVILTSANSFSGETVIRTGGRLILGNNHALQNSNLDTDDAGGEHAGTLYLSTGAAGGKVIGDSLTNRPTLGGLTGSRALSTVIASGNPGVNNTAALTHGNILGFTLNPGSGKAYNYSGAIADFATGTTLTKTGPGTQTLSGANTYSGATSIHEGTLIIDGSLSDTNAPLTVSSGATLGGTGTIGRNVTIESGGRLEFNLSTPPENHNRIDLSAGRNFIFSGESEITITATSGAGPGVYTLVAGGNNITGTAPATLNLPSGWVATTEISGDALLLNVASTDGGNPGSLAVAETYDFNASGKFGGPFSPGSVQYTLSNPGEASIEWTAGTTASWVDLSATSGTLAAGAEITVTVAINPTASSLAAGSYHDTVTFTNTTNGDGDTTRGLNLAVQHIAVDVTLANLSQTYDGSPRPVGVATNPTAVAHAITYNDEPDIPVDAGGYEISVTVTEPGHEGHATGTLVIAKAPQIIHFDALATVGDDAVPFDLTATTSSGLAISYASSNPDVATVSGNTVTIAGTGTTLITATQAGDDNHLAAEDVGQSLQVVRASPVADAGGPYTVFLNHSLSLDGRACLATQGATITSYDWDLNNDGSFGDVTGATPPPINAEDLINIWGMSLGSNPIHLKVTDSENNISITSTTVTIHSALTWDANAAVAAQTDGGGAWLGTGQWWNGGGNQDWIPGVNAEFGNGGPGGSVTLDSPTSAGSLSFNRFTGTYTLGTVGQTITLDHGILLNPDAGAVTITSPIILGGPQTWVNHSPGDDNEPLVTGAVDNHGHDLTIDGDAGSSTGGSGNVRIAGVLSGSGGLVKSGSGLVILAEAPAYGGDTTVNAGILQLSGPNGNNEASTVTIAEGATLHLDFSGTDLVDALFIGDTQMPAGVYKAVGGTASGTELPQLSGTGTLAVASGPHPELGLVHSFVIGGVPAQATVGTPITGVTITALDASDETATAFTGTVSFGGTAGITGTSASFVDGVLDGVSVTPTNAGSNLTFTVDDGNGQSGWIMIDLIQCAFTGWTVSMGLAGGETDAHAILQPDGLTNLQKFAFGMDPQVAHFNPVEFVVGGEVVAAGSPTLMNFAQPGRADDERAVFTRLKNHAEAGLAYAVEFSADLKLWTRSEETPVVITGKDNSSDYEVVSVRFLNSVPVASGGQQRAATFMRVSISNE